MERVRLSSSIAPQVTCGLINTKALYGALVYKTLSRLIGIRKNYGKDIECILLAKNRRFSSSKRTKHIKNRYFVIKGMIGKGEIIIQYCPTGEMQANINTKALQEARFYKMRA